MAQRRHFYGWLAMVGSIAIHLVLVFCVVTAIRMRSHMSQRSPEPITARIVFRPKPLPAIAKIVGSSKGTDSLARHQPAPLQRKVDDAPPSMLPPTAMARAPSSPEKAASSPSTEETLRRIEEGAVKAVRAQEARRQVEKPWLAASQPAQGRVDSERTTQGGRVERVHSALGTYCVVVPNGAAAYRSSNGFNLAGVSNCP